MSEKNYDVIVIGAGCGGLTAAACIAKEGKRVLILERHNAPGGFASSFVRGRFEFDVSLYQLCGFTDTAGLGDTRKIFDYLDISDKIKWTKIPDCYRLISKRSFDSAVDVTMPTGIDEFINTLENYVPGSKPSVTRLFKLAEEIEASTQFFSDFDSCFKTE